MRITKVGVIGAGAMGAGIAALATSAGLPVVLLDIPGTFGSAVMFPTRTRIAAKVSIRRNIGSEQFRSLPWCRAFFSRRRLPRDPPASRARHDRRASLTNAGEAGNVTPCFNAPI